MSLLSRLHDAVKDGDENTVSNLIDRGVDINATYFRETAFTEATQADRWSIAFLLLKHSSFNPNAGNQFDRTPLFYAAIEDRYDLAQALLEKGANVNQTDLRGVSPLGATAWYDSHNVAQLLLNRGADIDQQDDTGETPLIRACKNISLRVAELLLENGADASLKTFDNNSCPLWTPMMAALPTKYQLEVRKRTMSDMIKVLNLLLSYENDLNAVQGKGMTALHIAVDRNEIYGACLLAEHGCNLEVRDSNGFTPLHLAVQPDRPMYELALYLLLFGADANARFKDDKDKDILPLTIVMKTRPDSETVQQHRNRLLRALIPATNLCGRNIFEVIETMLEDVPVPIEDFNILQEFNVNQPPCLISITRRKIRHLLGQHIFQKLEQLPLACHLKKYLSLEYDYKKCHPVDACKIHVSISDKKTEQLRGLLKSGIHVNIPLNENIPLTLAAEMNNVRAVNLLLEWGASPELLDRRGLTSLHAAALAGSDSALKILLARNCDVNLLDSEGETALQVAAIAGHFSAVILLLDHGADPSLVGPSGLPALHLAAGSGHLRAVDRILKASVDINLQDRFENTPLHVAASKGIIYLENKVRLPFLYKDDVLEALDACKLSLSAGLPSYTKQEGVYHLGVIKRLISHGANLDIQNSNKFLPVDLSRKYFKDKEATLLLRH